MVPHASQKIKGFLSAMYAFSFLLMAQYVFHSIKFHIYFSRFLFQIEKHQNYNTGARDQQIIQHFKTWVSCKYRCIFTCLGCTCIHLLVHDGVQETNTRNGWRNIQSFIVLAQPTMWLCRASRAELHPCLDSMCLGLLFPSALRNCLVTSCIHDKDIFNINQTQLIPTFCAHVLFCIAL